MAFTGLDFARVEGVDNLCRRLAKMHGNTAKNTPCATAKPPKSTLHGQGRRTPPTNARRAQNAEATTASCTWPVPAAVQTCNGGSKQLPNPSPVAGPARRSRRSCWSRRRGWCPNGAQPVHGWLQNLAEHGPHGPHGPLPAAAGTQSLGPQLGPGRGRTGLLLRAPRLRRQNPPRCHRGGTGLGTCRTV